MVVDFRWFVQLEEVLSTDAPQKARQAGCSGFLFREQTSCKLREKEEGGKRFKAD